MCHNNAYVSRGKLCESTNIKTGDKHFPDRFWSELRGKRDINYERAIMFKGFVYAVIKNIN